MDMEKRLAEYRAKKARDARIEGIKSKGKHFYERLWKSREILEPEQKIVKDTIALIPPEEEETESVCSDESAIDDSINCFSYMDLLYYTLCFILWLILFLIFIKWEFGTVFLISSAIIFMYVNTRTGPKKRNEISAYSVFNQNCKSIDGTLKAEQFEREIRYGPVAVH